MASLIRPALVIFAVLSLVTGILYPLAMTGLAQVVFPERANGSIIWRGTTPVASSLIGQDFSQGPDAHSYFWGRLSATGPVPCTSFNAETLTGSSGSNLAATNPALVANAGARITALKSADDAAGYLRAADQRIPVDLVTASGSGLDPHISIAAAQYQLPRIAAARRLTEDRVRSFVREHTQSRQLGMLGEPVVNVLTLNLALDQATNERPPLR